MDYSSNDIDTDTDTDTDTMTYIEEPNENDILLGRGGKNNQWTGNDGLRTMAQSRCIEYQTAQKRAKSEISRELVQGVHNLDPPGRYLRKCSNTKGSIRWEVATDKVAREKTSQVLRDAIHAKKLLNSLGERNTRDKASPNSKDDDDDGDDDGSDDDAGSDSSTTTAGISVAKEVGEDVVHNKMKKTTGSVSSSTTTGSVGKVRRVRKEKGEEAHDRMKRTPVKQLSEQGCQSLPASASALASVTSTGSSNGRLLMGNRPTEHAFSPDTFPLPHPYTSSYGYSSSYGRVPISEAFLNRRYSREDATHFAMGSSSFPYQYPVTPSSSNIAISTAKKRRQRYCQESPLVHGYHHYDPIHQYPYPTPIRQNTPPPAGMRPVSMGTSPPNTKLRGLEFSPPAIRMHGMLPEHSCNAPFSSDRRNSSSLPQTTVKQEDDYTNRRGLVFSPPAISVHGMISGNSCSSVDTPFSSGKRSSSTLQIKVKQEDNSTCDETIQLPSTSNQQLHLSTTDSRGSNPEFDFLLNDDVLSDSEH